MTHETSYSAQFKGETSKPAPADNKFLERRRIRTLYSEPYKEPPKVRNAAAGPSLVLVGLVQRSKAGLNTACCRSPYVAFSFLSSGCIWGSTLEIVVDEKLNMT